MCYELVKIGRLSGERCTIYTIQINDEGDTLYNNFLKENIGKYKKELQTIASNLETIGHYTGAEHYFFKEKQGNIGDGVSYILCTPKIRIRLYCIKYGKATLIIGGGGFKPIEVKEYQAVPKLNKEVSFLKDVSKEISSKMRDKEIRFPVDGKDFEGDLILENINYKL